MSISKKIAFLSAACFSAALITLPGVSAAAEVIKFGSHIPPRSSSMKEAIIPFLERVQKDSNGAFQYKGFWGGSIMRNAEKQYEVLLSGLQDGTIVLPSYTEAIFPDFTLFTLPNLFRNAEEASTVMWRMHEQGLLGGLEKMYVMGLYSNGNSAFHVSKKIDSLAGLKGLKIRSAGPGESDVIKAMGAIPVGMSITQVAEAVNRSVVDGTLSGWEAIRSFRIEPLIVTSVDLPLGTRSFILALNRKVYERLPQQAKDALARHGGEKVSRDIGRVFDLGYEKMLAEAKKSPKKVVLGPNDVPAKEVEKAFKPFHDAWIREHKDGQKKYDALHKILAEVRKGR